MENILYEIFSSLTFYKVKNVDMYVMYVAQLQSFLAKGRECVVLLVPMNKAYYEKGNILQLQWSCLQTRILEDVYQLPEQVLELKNLDTRYNSKYPMKIISRNEKASVYSEKEGQTPIYSNFDIMSPKFEISLLHDPKKKSLYQYTDEIDLRHSLKTFKCIIKKS